MRHEANGLGLRGRLISEAMPTIGGRASVEECRDLGAADERLKLGFAQRFFPEVALLELGSQISQETSCFAAGRSGGFVIEDDRLLGHNFPLAPRASHELPDARRLIGGQHSQLVSDHFTTITGTAAFKTTSLPVSPRVTRPSPWRPREPMMIRSH